MSFCSSQIGILQEGRRLGYSAALGTVVPYGLSFVGFTLGSDTHLDIKVRAIWGQLTVRLNHCTSDTSSISTQWCVLCLGRGCLQWASSVSLGTHHVDVKGSYLGAT